MIQFPETAQQEWDAVAAAANVEVLVRQRIERATLVERETERLRVRHEADLIFQQELSAEETPALEMTTLATYRTNPTAAPKDLIEGVMKNQGLCTVLGPSGSGKSTLALQLLHSLLTGDDWLGQTVTETVNAVGVLSYDMDASMVLDWMDGFPGVDPATVSVVNAYRQGNPLAVPDMRAKIVAAWKAMAVEVVVLDSFSAAFFGHDQNDAAATMAWYRDMKKFALTEVGARVLVVILHSTDGSPGKARGSTVHKDAADTIVGVSADDAGVRKVKIEKYRAARGQRMMAPVIVSAPDDVTHLVGLDYGAMSLEGLPLPGPVSADVFPPLPDAIDQPESTAGTDTDTSESDSDEGQEEF